MNKIVLERLLNRYSGAWSGSGVSFAETDDLSPALRTELESFERLVDLLQRTLSPVQPREAFVAELRRSLMADAASQSGWRDTYIGPLRRHWKLTAATASGVSAAAAVSAVSAAIWYRGRNTM